MPRKVIFKVLETNFTQRLSFSTSLRKPRKIPLKVLEKKNYKKPMFEKKNKKALE